MYRIKDFFYKTVYDIKGKKLGSVRDIFIDFYKGKGNGAISRKLLIEVKE